MFATVAARCNQGLIVNPYLIGPSGVLIVWPGLPCTLTSVSLQGDLSFALSVC